MSVAADNIVVIGPDYVQIPAQNLLITLPGQTQQTLAALLLSSANFAGLNLLTLPTSNPGNGQPWLNGNPTDGYVLCVGP